MTEAQPSDTQLRCEICGGEFTSEEYLRDHQLTHTNRCPVCGAEFTTEAMLTDHRRLHDASSDAQREELLEQQGERKS